MDFEVVALDADVGAEIVGLDLDRPIGKATQRALYDAWLQAGILLFRGIGTSSQRQLTLSRCFGELDVHPIEAIRLAGEPEIICLSSRGDNDPILHSFDGEVVAGMIPWHTDLIYTPTPCRGGLLRMVESPTRGGETGWIDTAAAYAALPADLQQRIQGLEARFDFIADICDMRFGRPEKLGHISMGSTVYPEFPDVTHPLVWTHPESGLHSLCLSPINLLDVLGVVRAEGDALLEELVAHTTDGRFSYVHDWEEGDMVLWDNWRTLHTALGTPPDCEREVHRTTLRGAHATGRLL